MSRRRRAGLRPMERRSEGGVRRLRNVRGILRVRFVIAIDFVLRCRLIGVDKTATFAGHDVVALGTCSSWRRGECLMMQRLASRESQTGHGRNRVRLTT
jgi:hypothetical protein